MAEPICPVDCAATLPVVSFNECNPQVRRSEIKKVYIAKTTAAPFEDVEDPAEWAKRLSNTNTVPGAPTNTTPVDDLIRELTVIGDRPAPTTTPIEVSNDRTVVLSSDFVINATIDEITPENIEFARQTECGNMQVRVWHATPDLMFGGNSGYVYNIRASVVLDRGTNAAARIDITLTRRGKFSEEAVENPLAA